MVSSGTNTVGRMTLELQATGQVKRVWLENGALHRMMIERPTRFKVLQGTAWITHDGEDIVLQAGQRARIDPSAECTLVGALGGEPVVFEAW
ncbi:MAG: DUF2917 domain-containing protein [Anaerolineae bacterium]|nr:DUF2917 domain-containing protein [Anaerolineae bacterium]